MKPFSLYRRTNEKGNLVDWGLRVNGDGTYTVRWGGTGPNLPGHKTKPISRNDPMCDGIIRLKLRKGYSYMGEVYISDDGNLSPAGPPDPQVEPPASDTLLFWRLKVHIMLDMRTFLAIYHPIKRKIEALTPTDWDRLNLEDLTNTSGRLKAGDSHWNLLALMVLKKHGPKGLEVYISTEDGIDVSSNLKLESGLLTLFGQTLDSVREAAEDLGLLVKEFDPSSIETNFESFYF